MNQNNSLLDVTFSAHNRVNLSLHTGELKKNSTKPFENEHNKSHSVYSHIKILNEDRWSCRKTPAKTIRSQKLDHI